MPHVLVYEWDTPHGVHRSLTATRWNGSDPTRVLHCLPLTPAEVQSGMTRVRWAELLIRQLPKDHEGRNSWLLNYATADHEGHRQAIADHEAEAPSEREDLVMLPKIGAVPRRLMGHEGIKALQRMAESVRVIDETACWDHTAMFEVRDQLCAALATQPQAGCPQCKRTDGRVCDWCPSLQPQADQVEATHPLLASDIRARYGIATQQAAPSVTAAVDAFGTAAKDYGVAMQATPGDTARQRAAYLGARRVLLSATQQAVQGERVQPPTQASVSICPVHDAACCEVPARLRCQGCGITATSGKKGDA